MSFWTSCHPLQLGSFVSFAVSETLSATAAFGLQYLSTATNAHREDDPQGTERTAGRPQVIARTDLLDHRLAGRGVVAGDADALGEVIEEIDRIQQALADGTEEDRKGLGGLLKSFWE